MIFALAIPAKVGNFEFRHFEEEEGLNVSISRSVLPRWPSEDEKLLPVPVEPIQALKMTKGSKLLVAGQYPVWPKLKNYSKRFERKYRKNSRSPRASLTQLMALVSRTPSSNEPRPIRVYAMDFPKKDNAKKTVRRKSRTASFGPFG